MRRIAYLAGASLLLASMSVAVAQKKSGAETSLIGIHLYDSGLKVVSVFGTPTSVEAVNIGGTGGGAGGPAGGGGKNRGGGGPPGPGGAGMGVTGPASSNNSFGFGDALLAQQASGGQAMLGPGAQQYINPPGGGAPAGAGGPGGKGGPGGGGEADKVVFTRWVYNRAGCKYGFVFDKFNHVIQIEAIGMSNPRVHTQRGIGFGSSFAQIIKKYSKNPDGTANAPDGYEVSGDTIVVHYLVTNKVAFRLSRLGKDKPQVVTGIAVAAGKI